MIMLNIQGVSILKCFNTIQSNRNVGVKTLNMEQSEVVTFAYIFTNNFQTNLILISRDKNHNLDCLYKTPK